MDMNEIILEVMHDSIPMLPFLFLTYLLLEWLEHREHHNTQRYLLSLQKVGPIFGAVLGILPQCGFSVIASGLYVDGAISLGTLIAVFISTSDEAIPILIAHPDHASLLAKVIVLKIVLAMIVGYLVDLVLQRRHHSKSQKAHEFHCSCEVNHGSIWKNALVRTLKIFVFVWVVNFLLTTLIALIGEDQLGAILLEKSFLQPFFATLLGFLPNCAASVILAQLFILDMISFGALMAGLISSAGLGLMVLLKVDKNRKEVGMILLILFLSAFLSGTLLQFLM